MTTQDEHFYQQRSQEPDPLKIVGRLVEIISDNFMKGFHGEVTDFHPDYGYRVELLYDAEGKKISYKAGALFERTEMKLLSNAT